MRGIGLLIGVLCLATASPALAFKVKGKKGQFLARQVVAADLAKADQTLNDGTTRGLLGKSIDRGELQGIALDMPNTRGRLLAMLGDIRAVWAGKTGGKWQLRDPGDISIRILATDDYGAKVKPDNVMLVSLGLLRQRAVADDPAAQIGAGAPKSDDEIYWVLAHEFAHIGLAHFAKDANDIKAKARLDKMVTGVAAMGSLAQIKLEKTASGFRVLDRNDPKTREATDKAWGIASRVREGITLVFSVLDLDQEDEADVAATDIVREMKLSQQGYGSALARIGQEDDSQKKRAKAMEETVKSLLLPSQGLMDILTTTVQTFLQSGGKLDLGLIASAYGKNVLRNLAPAAFSVAKTQFSRSHRDQDDREKGLTQYVKDARLQGDWGTKLHSSRLQAIWDDPEYKEAEILVNAIGKAREALALGNYSDALAAMQPAVNTRYANSPALANMVARILGGMNRLDEAESWYDRAAGMNQARPVPAVKPPTVSRQPARGATATRRAATVAGQRRAPSQPVAPPPPAPAPAPKQPVDPYYGQSIDGFQDHVDLLIRATKFRRALDVIAETKRRFGDDDGFLPRLVQIHTLTNNGPQQIAALARCGQLESQKVAEQCLGALSRDANGEDKMVMSAEDREKRNALVAKLGDVARINTEAAKPVEGEDPQ